MSQNVPRNENVLLAALDHLHQPEQLHKMNTNTNKNYNKMNTNKSHIPKLQIVRAVLLAASVLLTFNLASYAMADTTYRYTGNIYTGLGGSYQNGEPYALSVEFTTTMTGNALDNLPFVDISSTITSYSFADGSGLNLNNINNGLGINSLSIEIATDGSGKIVDWFVGAYICCPANTQMQSNWKSPYGFIQGADFSETTANFAGNYGFVGNDPGTWSETTTPEPGTLFEADYGSGDINQFTA